MVENDSNASRTLSRADFARFIDKFARKAHTDFHSVADFMIMLAVTEDDPSEEIALLVSPGYSPFHPKVQCHACALKALASGSWNQLQGLPPCTFVLGDVHLTCQSMRCRQAGLPMAHAVRQCDSQWLQPTATINALPPVPPPPPPPTPRPGHRFPHHLSLEHSIML